MVILLITEIGVGIAGYVLRDDISDTIQKNMEQLMNDNYLDPKTNATRDLFDTMHEDVSFICKSLLIGLYVMRIKACFCVF